MPNTTYFLPCIYDALETNTYTSFQLVGHSEPGRIGPVYLCASSTSTPNKLITARITPTFALREKTYLSLDVKCPSHAYSCWSHQNVQISQAKQPSTTTATGQHNWTTTTLPHDQKARFKSIARSDTRGSANTHNATHGDGDLFSVRFDHTNKHDSCHCDV